MDSSNEDTQTRKRRTGEHAARVGGRSERVVRDVLGASAKELARVGYAALRMDDVAAAAGVNKTTVYRRWPTKPELVRATLETLNNGLLATPDLGSIRADLLSLLAAFVARMESPEKRCIARMIFADLEHPEVQELVRAMREEHRVPWRTVITRSIEARRAARGDQRAADRRRGARRDQRPRPAQRPPGSRLPRGGGRSRPGRGQARRSDPAKRRRRRRSRRRRHDLVARLRARGSRARREGVALVTTALGAPARRR